LAETLHRYEVSVAESLDRLAVHACFAGLAPQALVAESDGARIYLEDARVGEVALQPDGDRLVLNGAAEGACVRYQVKLAPVRNGAQSGGPETRWVGRDLLTSIGDWLWRPQELSTAADIELSFKLPAGVAASVPWQRVADSEGRPAYRIGFTPYNWSGVAAFGRFVERDIAVPGATVHLALLDGPTPAQQAGTERWVERAARNVASLYGRFPVGSVQVIVAPTSRGRGPVPWAYAARGGGPAVHLFVNPGHSAEDFDRDWSATHEMSHLLLPYVVSRDAWLAEGLPTYLQNVLMVRGGVISVEEGWRRMILGFQRGARTGAGLNLAQASERIAVGGNYLRVYWAGAAMMLEADLLLRETTQGRHSLDTALAGLADCCLAQHRRWTAAELVARLDQLTGTSVFSELVRKRFEANDFPDFKAVLVRAGVTVVNGEVVLDSGAPAAAAREALMRPPAIAPR
jgi:hypothetical protein